VGSTVQMNNTIFSYNSLVTQFGDHNSSGALNVFDSNVTLYGCTFSNNNVFNNDDDLSGHGGGINFDLSTLVAIDCKFTNNSASFGGAISITQGTLILINSTITNNSATFGAGISLLGTDVTVTITVKSPSDIGDLVGCLLGSTLSIIILPNSCICNCNGIHCNECLSNSSSTIYFYIFLLSTRF